MGCCQSNTVEPQPISFVHRPPSAKSDVTRTDSQGAQIFDQDTSPQTSNRQKKPRIDDNESAEIALWKSTIASLLQKTQLKNYALSKSQKQLGSIARLIDFLKRSPANNQLEQVWVIYCWVTHNISYNGRGYQLKQYGQQDAESVFMSGSAVCEGYASLMKRCCDDLGITCRKVSGYAKGFGFKQGDKFDDTNHAWNAVQVDGDSQWRLVESTWGSGNLSKSYDFNRQFDPYYFFVPPHVLIATHFSEDFQLQHPKLTLREFEQRSKLKKSYYVSGLKCISHDIEEGIVNLREQTAMFVFEVPNANDTRYLTARLENTSGTKIENTVLVQKRGRRYEMSIALPEVQTVYSVLLFKSIENVDSTDLGHIQVKCIGTKQFGGGEIFLCRYYSGSEKAYLVSPLRRTLHASTTQLFSIWLEDAEAVAVVDEANTYHHLQCCGSNEPPNAGQQLWAVKHFIDMTGKYSLYVKYSNESGSKSYHGLFEFNALSDISNVKLPANVQVDYTTPILRCLSHDSVRVNSTENPVVMSFHSTENVNVLVSLKDEQDKKLEGAVLAQKKSNGNNDFQITLSVILPRTENAFKLDIFFNRGESETFTSCRTYSLQWTAKNRRDDRRYCNFSPPRNHEAYLFEPTHKELKLSKPQNFKILLREAIDVALVDSAETWYHFSREDSSENDGIWIYEQFTPKNRGECNVYAKFNQNDKSSKFVCGYSVV